MDYERGFYILLITLVLNLVLITGIISNYKKGIKSILETTQEVDALNERLVITIEAQRETIHRLNVKIVELEFNNEAL